MLRRFSHKIYVKNLRCQDLHYYTTAVAVDADALHFCLTKRRRERESLLGKKTEAGKKGTHGWLASLASLLAEGVRTYLSLKVFALYS